MTSEMKLGFVVLPLALALGSVASPALAADRTPVEVHVTEGKVPRILETTIRKRFGDNTVAPRNGEPVHKVFVKLISGNSWWGPKKRTHVVTMDFSGRTRTTDRGATNPGKWQVDTLETGQTYRWVDRRSLEGDSLKTRARNFLVDRWAGLKAPTQLVFKYDRPATEPTLPKAVEDYATVIPPQPKATPYSFPMKSAEAK